MVYIVHMSSVSPHVSTLSALSMTFDTHKFLKNDSCHFVDTVFHLPYSHISQYNTLLSLRRMDPIGAIEFLDHLKVPHEVAVWI